MQTWIKKVQQLHEAQCPAVIITITSTKGSSPAKSGAKMIVTEAGIVYGTIGGGKLEHQAVDDATALLKSNQSSLQKSYPLGAAFGQCCGGSVELFMDVINTNPILYIFGAGHIGQALANIMKDTIFEIKLIDSRENWFESLSESDAIEFIDEESSFYEELVHWDDQRTYLVVLTHLHDLDQEIIEFSIKHPSKYIGLIGSQTKWKLFQKRISDKNGSSEKLDQVHCPIGLDIGAESPQEIAISIASELLKTHYGR